jgi:hypothetical protein
MMSGRFGGLIVCVASTIYYCMACVIRANGSLTEVDRMDTFGQLLAGSSEYVDVGASSDRNK